MLHRITYDAKAWETDVLNNDSLHRGAYMVPADREYVDPTNLAAASHLYGNGTYSKATYTLHDGSTLEGYGIYHITKHDDGTLTFDFRENLTGIKDIPSVSTSDNKAIYTLGGQRVEHITKPGIYIEGGKKAVRR